MDNTKFVIGERVLASGQPPYVVAEIGVNFNGDMELAKKSIAAAAIAGADAAKFQTFRAEEFMANANSVYEYQSGGKIVRESIYEMFKRLELPKSWHIELQEYCRSKGVEFLSSCADPVSVDVLMEIGASVLKLSSEDLINMPLIKYAAGLNVPVILSTGMADEREIEEALNALQTGGCPSILLLHCVSLYPTLNEDANLLRMVTLKDRYGMLVGYSDHTIGSDAAVAATALGALFIEKHFTLDKTLSGPDHAMSADPEDLADLIQRTRRVSVQMGSGAIAPQQKETAAKLQHRRSIVSRVDIANKTLISREMLHIKRPGAGLHPREIENIIGKCATHDISANTHVSWDDFK